MALVFVLLTGDDWLLVESRVFNETSGGTWRAKRVEPCRSTWGGDGLSPLGLGQEQFKGPCTPREGPSSALLSVTLHRGHGRAGTPSEGSRSEKPAESKTERVTYCYGDCADDGTRVALDELGRWRRLWEGKGETPSGKTGSPQTQAPLVANRKAT